MKLTLFFKLFSLAFLAFGSYYVWHVHFNYRFEEITPNKVYKSALIPPDELGNYLENNSIKTVINLLDPGTQDSLNPATQAEIDAEEKAINEYNRKHNKAVNHINIQSGQVPSKENLEHFFEVLDSPDVFPVLIHCYHGTGRAQMYSALYRIEYDNWSNSDARAKTRVVLSALGYKSSFALGRPKGEFLNNYVKRSRQEKQLAKNNISLGPDETR